METPNRTQAEEYRREYGNLRVSQTAGNTAVTSQVQVGGEAADWEAEHLVGNCGD